MPSIPRYFLGILVIVGLLIATACAPAAAPTPTTALPKPTAAQPPATAAPAAAAPAAKPDSAPAAKPAASADWKAEWDKTVAAAKQEGKVVVSGAPGDQYRAAAMAFQKAYPDIQLEYLGEGVTFDPKLIAERDAGKYLWDVRITGGTVVMTTYRPRGILDPIRPALILPEILDSSKWVGGFEDSWVENDRKYAFMFEGSIAYMVWVNRDLVPESELNSIDQLLDPKWKGKIFSFDPRVPSIATVNNGHMVMMKGDDWLRKLLSQDLTISTDARQVVEGIIRGKYPIGMGINRSTIEPFWKEGLGKNVKPLDPENPAAHRLNTGFGNVMLISRPPHPNAAKVFVNWLLSAEGQKAYVDSTGMNSRRLDVQGPAAYAPKPNVRYPIMNIEEREPITARAINIAKEIFK